MAAETPTDLQQRDSAFSPSSDNAIPAAPPLPAAGNDDEGVAPSSTRSSPGADSLGLGASPAPECLASDDEHDDHHHHDHEHEDSLLHDGDGGDVTNGKLEQRRIDILAVKLGIGQPPNGATRVEQPRPGLGPGSGEDADSSDDEPEEKDKKRVRGRGPPTTLDDDGGETVEANRFVCVSPVAGDGVWDMFIVQGRDLGCALTICLPACSTTTF